MLHMVAHLDHIIVKKLYQQQCHLIAMGVVDSLDEFEADFRQGVVDECRMGPLQVVHQCGKLYREAFVGMPADKIAYSQKGIGVDTVLTAYFIDSAIAKPEWDAEAGNGHKEHVVMTDQ